ncbi:hypothetical protein [Nonomuraea sp. NPDC049141]|uniref:hypothetical protein n=1 Tax=Nonomuraea sp. NPDC049141 TaxID=3155500 RepID=UPI0033C62BA2
MLKVVHEDLLRAAREAGAETATAPCYLPTDIASVAVMLGLIDRETFYIMNACHRAFEQARAEVEGRRSWRLKRSMMKRKMTTLGRQDYLDGRAGVRQERELAEHFGLMDSCTLDELADYHYAYLQGFNGARKS